MMCKVYRTKVIRPWWGCPTELHSVHQTWFQVKVTVSIIRDSRSRSLSIRRDSRSRSQCPSDVIPGEGHKFSGRELKSVHARLLLVVWILMIFSIVVYDLDHLQRQGHNALAANRYPGHNFVTWWFMFDLYIYKYFTIVDDHMTCYDLDPRSFRKNPLSGYNFLLACWICIIFNVVVHVEGCAMALIQGQA